MDLRLSFQKFLGLALFSLVVVFNATAGAPNANFSVTPAIAMDGDCVTFIDESSAALGGDDADAWQWTINGVQFSTAQNPPCQILTEGTYNVCLVASNSDGASDPHCEDVVVHEAYKFGTDASATTCSGYIVDDGGGSGNYSDNSTQLMTLCSGSTDNVQVFFDSNDEALQLAANDVINVYDGSDVTGCLITQVTSANNTEGGFFGSSYTLQSYSSCMTLEFITDATGNDMGFVGVISCFTIANPISADGTTITGCGVDFNDDGGVCGDYAPNLNSAVTFCTGSSDNVYNWVLDSLGLGAGDQLVVHAGTSTADPVILTLNSSNNSIGSQSHILNSPCVTIEFISNGSSEGFGWISSLNCRDIIYEIDDQDGNTIITCDADFMDSGLNGNYSNNENYTVTFCTGNASTAPQFLFQNLNLASGDVLNVYDGTGTGGSLIYTIESSDNGNNSLISPGLTVSGISQCVTFEFISNGSGTSSGWNADVSCQTPPAPCNTNPVAADNFDAATMICDFSQYCGVTSSFYGVDMDIGSSSLFSGSIENNSWLQFVADASTASFNLTTNCSNSGDAIQVGIYAVDANENFTLISPASINGGVNYTATSGFVGSGVINAEGMTPGETYYIMVDGQGGDVCDYSLTAGIGVQLPDPLASPDLVMCYGDPETITVTDQNGSTNIDWEWTWNSGAGGPLVQDNVDLSTFVAGTYTFTVEADDFSECVSSLSDQVVVTIDPCSFLPVELMNFRVACNNSERVIFWETASELNNSHFILQRMDEGGQFVNLATIIGAGNSSSVLSYSFTDPRQGNVVYYKLIQVDYDGTRTESQVVISEDCSEMGNEIYVQNNTVVYSYANANAELISCSLITNTGQVIKTASKALEKGVNNVVLFDLNGVSTGTYFVQIDSSTTSRRVKRIFVK